MAINSWPVRQSRRVGHHSAAGLLAHPALEYMRCNAASIREFGRHVEVFGPLSEHQHVATAVDGVEHIGANLRGAGLIGDERSKGLLDGEEFPAPAVEFVSWVMSRSVMDAAVCVGEVDLVSHGTALHRDDCLEPIAPIRGCGGDRARNTPGHPGPQLRTSGAGRW